MRTNVSFNYAIFCTSVYLHQHLCKDFKENYDAAIIIDRPFPFFHELSKAFESCGLVENVLFQQVDAIAYQSRNIEVGTEVVEALVKTPHYQHQGEVRALWNIGHPKQRFYRFKAPHAAKHCRIIKYEDMPSYDPGLARKRQEEQQSV